MKISIFGSGYVGLVAGACLAEMGNQVICVDIDPVKINKLKKGEVPIFEPGLENVITRNLDKSYLDFTTDTQSAIEHGDVIFIAVGTPPNEDGSADMQHVLSVANTIAEHINSYKVIVIKSTVPIGTADKVTAILKQALGNAQDLFDVVSNPEFLKEGAAIADYMKPDRIIIGSDSEKAIAMMRQLYLPFSRNHEKFITMDVRSSEMTKYAANAMLATKVSFINEMSQIAERVGADINQVRIGIGSDHRISSHFIYPGCGYGGSCFPKDVKALTQIAQQHDYPAHILQAVDTVNKQQKKVLFQKISEFYGGDLQGTCFAMWGLAFKPGTDDIREAPALVLLDQLINHGAMVRVYDPEAMDNVKTQYGEHPQIIFADSAYHAITSANALCLLTEWQEFRSPDFKQLAEKLSDSAIFDGRNLYQTHICEAFGLHYFRI